MMKLFLSFLVAICGVVFFSTVTRAETALFFAPSRVELSGEKPVDEIRVTNMSSIARSYRILLQDIVMSEDGATNRVDGFEYSAKRMVRYVPRQFVLKPGERQIIRIMARYPEGTPDGAYHAHLEFLEDIGKRAEVNELGDDDVEARARMMAQISYSTAVPVVLSKGQLKTDIDMADIVLSKDAGGANELNLTLLRSGNGQGNALIDVDYVAPDGSVKKAASQRSVAIYREIDRRFHKIVLDLLNEGALKAGGHLEVKLSNRDLSGQPPVRTISVSVP